MRLQAEEMIERPPSEVFRFVATEHFMNHPKWDPSVVEMIPTSPGPTHRGSTARLVRSRARQADRRGNDGHRVRAQPFVRGGQPIRAVPVAPARSLRPRRHHCYASAADDRHEGNGCDAHPAPGLSSTVSQNDGRQPPDDQVARRGRAGAMTPTHGRPDGPGVMPPKQRPSGLRGWV
jgi:hypothetical protein